MTGHTPDETGGRHDEQEATVVLTCGWCRTVIPSQDEVQHHFFAAHGQAVNQSVRYHYPGAGRR